MIILKFFILHDAYSASTLSDRYCILVNMEFDSDAANQEQNETADMRNANQLTMPGDDTPMVDDFNAQPTTNDSSSAMQSAQPEADDGVGHLFSVDRAALQAAIENVNKEVGCGVVGGTHQMPVDNFSSVSRGGGEDALSTLATEALKRNDTSSVNGALVKCPASGSSGFGAGGSTETRGGESPWYDVGIIKGTSCVVKNYYESEGTNDHENLNIDNLPDFASRIKRDLEPGTAYKFRIAAINSCGRGEWSEPSAFKTCLPGYPGAPSAIKITKSTEGAHLSWEPPAANSGRILEYSVCLAVKNSIAGLAQTDTKVTGLTSGNNNQLAFFRVYCGPQNHCVVNSFSLTAAHIDTSTKPAIIFRIAAKNDKGYGPATQVRWLQDAPSKPQYPPGKRDNPPSSSSQQQPSKKYRTDSL